MYESDHISLLRDLLMTTALNFDFLSILLNLKEKDHIKRKIRSKKNQYYHYFDLPKIRFGRGRTTKI